MHTSISTMSPMKNSKRDALLSTNINVVYYNYNDVGVKT